MLDDTQKLWILKQTGTEIYSKSKKLLEEGKITAETMREMNAFWLEQNGKSIRRTR